MNANGPENRAIRNSAPESVPQPLDDAPMLVLRFPLEAPPWAQIVAMHFDGECQLGQWLRSSNAPAAAAAAVRAALDGMDERCAEAAEIDLLPRRRAA